MLAFIKSGFTTDKGELDDARVAAFLLVLTYIVASIYAIQQGQTWNPKDFGIGAGALVLGIGGWFGFRGNN